MEAGGAGRGEVGPGGRVEHEVVGRLVAWECAQAGMVGGGARPHRRLVGLGVQGGEVDQGGEVEGWEWLGLGK